MEQINLQPMKTISDKRLKKLARKGYRHTYLREMTVGWIIHQIRALREQRGWSQAKLGEEAGKKPQSAIARIELATYGKWNVSTLLELAEAFDVALEVRFVDWPNFLDRTDDTSPAAMLVNSFNTAEFSTSVTAGVFQGTWNSNRSAIR